MRSRTGKEGRTQESQQAIGMAGVAGRFPAQQRSRAAYINESMARAMSVTAAARIVRPPLRTLIRHGTN